MQRFQEEERKLHIERLKHQIAELQQNPIRGYTSAMVAKLKIQLRYHSDDAFREHKKQQAKNHKKRLKSEERDSHLDYVEKKPKSETTATISSKVIPPTTVSPESSRLILNTLSMFNQLPDPIDRAIEKFHGLDEELKPYI